MFNIGEDDGFVIVSGDDRTVPVLGYSDEGSFAPDKIPANMKAWLDGYAQQLKALAQLPDAVTGTVARTTRGGIGTRNSIAPLISTKWDQATPYWNECPDFVTEYTVDPETGERVAVATEKAYTGCVATSMSQMMYFHKYPVEETPEIPAYTFIVPGDNYQYTTVTHEALPPTVFDWANMRETYTGAEPEVNTAAVARLMHYTGCALKTQYGVSSSGAYTDDIPKAFSLFGYGSKLAYRNDYTQEAWENLVYSELAEGRPMIYNGTAGSGGGHSFICDGFEYGDYFHINWGWGGMGNGYFLLSILNPKDSGIGASTSSEGYNMKQNIIYNIIPGGSTEPVEEEGPMLTVTAISGPDSPWARDKSSEPFKIFKSRIVKVSFSDHSGSGIKFKEALALYDSLADTYTLLANSQSYNYSTVTTSALGQTTKFGDGIQSNASNVIKFGAGLTGKYRLVPFVPITVTNATDNVAIDWFRSSSDSGKQFWVCDFVEEDGTTVYFRNAPEMQANVPYLVAVPDDAWGSKRDLRGKQIVWSATNATVKPDVIAYTSGRNLAFGGTFCAADIDNGMGMNAEGSLFSSENTKLGAFRAYFKNISENDAPQSARFFNIKMADGTTTGISTAIGSDSYTAVYNMKGQRIGTKSQLQQLPRGVYVVGGAKVMR